MRVTTDDANRLLQLWSAVPALVGAFDRSLVYQSVNRAYESWFGLGPEEVVGRTVAEVIGPEAFAIVEPWIREALQGRVVQHEVTLPYRLGGSRHVLVIHAPDRDGQGQVQGAFVLVHDLSVRRAAEDRLTEQEREFRALFELAATGMAQLDPASRRFTRVNQKLCELTGYAEAELVGRTFSDLTHPDDRERDQAVVLPVLRGEREGWEIEKRYLRRDGGVVWVIVSGRLIRDDQGRPVRAYSTVLDVDARRRAEQQVRDAAAEFDAFFELSGSGKARLDPITGRFVRVNRKFCEIIGYSPEDLLGLSLEDLTHPDDRGRGVPFGDSHGQETEKRFLRKSGAVVWVRIDTSVLRDGTGPPRGVLASIRDITAEKEAEAAVRESEARFRGLFEGSPVPILVEDFSAVASRISELRDGGAADLQEALSHPDEVRRLAQQVRVLEASPASVSFFGAPDLPGVLTSVAHFLADGSPEAWDVFRDELLAFARGETTFTAHYPLRQPGREERAVLLSMAVAPGHERALDRVLLTFVDLTERQRAEAELRATKDWLEVVLGGISDGFVVCDRDFRFRFIGGVDAERFRASGVDPATLIGRTLWEVFPHLPPEAVEKLHLAMDARGPVSFEAQLSQHRWYEVRAYTTADGGLSLLSPDITERKRVEAELQDSRAMLEASQRMAHVGSWVVALEHDLGQGELQWSAETFRIFGWEPSEVAVSNELFFSQVHPDDRPRVRAARDEALRLGAPYRVQHRIRRPHGEERVVEEWAVVETQEGRASRMLGTVQDVTDRVWAEKALLQADRRKDEFLAILAHELRNPLAPIRSSVAVLRAPRASPEQRDWAREVIERQIGHMARLLDDLLDVSRITRNKLELRRERTDVARVVQLALETSRPLLDAAHHQVIVDVPEEPLQVDGDPVRLSQVFANLLNNAAKYTPEGGRIEIRIVPRGPEVAVSVRDDGIGIAPEALPHLFEMFSQVQPANRRAQGGLGIGLALVRGLVELHGGRIEAHSDGVGKGSCFEVCLPRLVVPAEEPVPAQVERPQRRHRIVVADDQHDTADSLAMLLRHEGYDVRTAYDGEEALAVTREVRPEIVLLDIGMPKLDGYEAARAIRSSPEGRDMVLIAATGWGQDEDRRRALTAGFDHHLTKPIDPDALLDLLSRVEDSA